MAVAVCSALALTSACGASHPAASRGSHPPSVRTSGGQSTTAAPAATTSAHSRTPAPPVTSTTLRSTTPPVGTQRVVLRPVTGARGPATGYSITDETTGSVDCGTYADPSPVAVDRGILMCTPSAESAVACWPERTASHVLCLRDAWSTQLYRIPTSSGVPAVAGTPHPQPLGLTLDDGDHCTIRDGGAWSQPVQHPTWFGWYSCLNDGAVWGPETPANANGIDRSTAQWSVTVGALSGAAPLSTRHVVTAYFVGTLGL